MEILDQTLFVMPNWKWVALGLIVIGGYIARPILRAFLLKAKAIPKNWPKVKDRFTGHLLELRIEQPISGLIIALIWVIAFDALQMPIGLEKYFLILAHLWLALNLIILAVMMVDAIGMLLVAWARQTESSFDDQLVPFAMRALKILVVILGVLVLLQNLGVNVVSILAGLSLGGLALALAAQDTFANLFGSITIFFDNPFKVGDQIKINDTEGIVEEIGFRSTRLRTAYNSLVTLPNAVVAKEKIDNLGARPARRVTKTLGLTYDTKPERIEEFCTAVEFYLKDNQQIIPETVQVYFTNYGSSTLDIQMTFHIKTHDANIELKVTEQVNLEVLRISQNLKVDFAFPTQTVYHKGPAVP